MKRTAIHTIEGTLECITGLHVGGSQDDLQIGGTDLPVIRHPVTLAPYVPGSSLKGKMRSELEKRLGKFSGKNGEEPCGCDLPDCPVCRVFGPHKKAEHHQGPTRLLVRDAPLSSGGEIEIKTENVINRKTGAAEHPRKQERVAAGSKFHVEIKVQVYDLDDSFNHASKAGGQALLEVVREALRSVEETGLGAGTSRGSGKVRFDGLTLNGKEW
ncbi:MAG TPA: type III-A CRISPR-associated RAMP protein Csm3 [Terriglobia bacterium]|nr:type III-A CRISPR-associated RAMP protein Csm3 [Terriglobia bacterium]